LQAFATSTQSYDKHLLSRIGGPSTSNRQSVSYTSGGVYEYPLSAAVDRRHSSISSAAASDRRQGSFDSISSLRWPPSSIQWNDYSTNTSRHGSLASAGSISQRGSYDSSMFLNEEAYAEDSQLNNLHLDEQSPNSPRAGSKRRAVSPPHERDDRLSISGTLAQNDGHLRRVATTRISPVSSVFMEQTTASPASTATRHGSLKSSLGVASVPSSATSYASGRISPPSSTRDAVIEFNSGIFQSKTKDTATAATAASRTPEASEDGPPAGKLPPVDISSHSRNSSLTQAPGVHVCECCPKKPRRFETEAELRLVDLHKNTHS